MALVINVVERMANNTAAIVTHVLGVVVDELPQNYHSLLTVRGSIVTQSYGSLSSLSSVAKHPTPSPPFLALLISLAARSAGYFFPFVQFVPSTSFTDVGTS